VISVAGLKMRAIIEVLTSGFVTAGRVQKLPAFWNPTQLPWLLQPVLSNLLDLYQDTNDGPIHVHQLN